MKPIRSDVTGANAAGERCIARVQYAMDIGGVRSRDTAAVVRQVVHSAERRSVPVRKVDLPLRGVMMTVYAYLAPAEAGLDAHPFVIYAVDPAGAICSLTHVEVRAIRPALDRLFSGGVDNAIHQS